MEVLVHDKLRPIVCRSLNRLNIIMPSLSCSLSTASHQQLLSVVHSCCCQFNGRVTIELARLTTQMSQLVVVLVCRFEVFSQVLCWQLNELRHLNEPPTVLFCPVLAWPPTRPSCPWPFNLSARSRSLERDPEGGRGGQLLRLNPGTSSTQDFTINFFMNFSI